MVFRTLSIFYVDIDRVILYDYNQGMGTSLHAMYMVESMSNMWTKNYGSKF